MFQDSFFGAESRSDAGLSSEFGAIGSILRGGIETREQRPSPASGSFKDTADAPVAPASR